jgi:hypothetical protein
MQKARLDTIVVIMDRFRLPPLTLIGVAILLAASSCAADKKVEPEMATMAQPDTQAESIGVASQETDGTIILTLRATGEGGIVGGAQFRYPPTHPQYAMIKAHVGPIPPGKSVNVRPFPQ